jgi:hypothetical protein
VLSIGKLGAEQAGYYERQVANGRDDYYSGQAKPQFSALIAASDPCQAHLRAEVRDRLGWQWGPVGNGAAELTHVAPQVLSEFSRRRHEITAAAELVIADHEARHGELTAEARCAMRTDLLSGCGPSISRCRPCRQAAGCGRWGRGSERTPARTRTRSIHPLKRNQPSRVPASSGLESRGADATCAALGYGRAC